MQPIIKTFLDIDDYKLTMGQFVFLSPYADVQVKFAFKNRTKGIKLADYVDEDELRWQLDFVQTQIISSQELSFLAKIMIGNHQMYAADYLKFLSKMKRLPDYSLKKKHGNFELEFVGPWQEVMYWETKALAIISQLYNVGFMAKNNLELKHVYDEGRRCLFEKISILKQYPGIIIVDFGHRRRFSFEWHDYIVRTLKQELPDQFLGTSDTYLAMKHSIPPKGTSAHEPRSIYAALAKNKNLLCQAAIRFSQDWYNLYGSELSIELPDTFGTNSLLEQMTRGQVQDWKGFRHDSGNPIEFGEKIIAFYEKHKVDPRSKLIIFSDGLDVNTIVRIYKHFCGHIKVSFGWGTNLTNDVGIKPLSLVIKVVEAGGRPAVKLSDNPAKAIGHPKQIRRYKKFFGYPGGEYQKCTY